MAGARFESDEVTLRRRNPWEIALISAVAALGPVLGWILAMAMRSPVPLLLAPLALAAAALRYRANARPVERLGKLSIGPLGIFFDGRRLASSAGLVCRGVSAVDGDAPLVRIGSRSGTFEVRVVDNDEAERLALALAPEEVATQTVRLPSRVLSQPGQLARFGLYAVVLTGAFPIVGLAWHANRTMALFLLFAALAAVAGLVAGLMADTIVELLPVGISVTWLGRKRLLPYATIEAIRMVEEAADWAGTRTQPYLSITMKNGEVVRLPVGDAPSEAIRDLLRKARRALTQRPSTPAEVAVQSRGAGVHAWFESLRSLASGDGPATHRTAPVAPEALWRVVEDPDGSSEARAGAAVALVSALGEDAKTRLRIAALNAPPRVRIAFETAAHATSEAELEQALAEVAEPINEPSAALTYPLAGAPAGDRSPS